MLFLPARRSILNPLVRDPDARDYIRRVEAADGQPLPNSVRRLFDEFVRGCKADGTWPALKACVPMIGARTLSGALVPLVGPAPTNFNFVSGDYNRRTGLAGDGSTKYLDSNRASNADPQDSAHATVFVTAGATVTEYAFLGALNSVATGGTQIVKSAANNYAGRLNTATTSTIAPFNFPGLKFLGVSRASSAQYTAFVEGASYTVAVASNAPVPQSIHVFQRNFSIPIPTNARLAFYSIGEFLDLALLDARVTTLVNGIAAALP